LVIPWLSLGYPLVILISDTARYRIGIGWVISRIELIRLFFGKGNQVQAGVSNKLINIFMDTSKSINKRITHFKRYRASNDHVSPPH